MSEDNRLEAAVLHGREAETILKSHSWAVAKLAIKGDIIEKLESQEILNNNESLVELVRELQAFNKLSDKLEQIISDGKFAEHEREMRDKDAR